MTEFKILERQAKNVKNMVILHENMALPKSKQAKPLSL